MAQTVLDLLNQGRLVNHTDAFRRGNVVHLPAVGDLIATGDIHGHDRNLERIVNFADLENHPDRHVLLQEIIHGGPEDIEGGCVSYKVLFGAIRYKLQYPDRVHMIMGNHDTAFICSSEVMKNGKEMNRAMCAAIEREFHETCDDVKLAIRQFLFSQPLAIRCENRLWLSHSLPADRLVGAFDAGVMDRELKINDCEKPGSAYVLTWGRRHSPELLARMADLFDVDLFVLGHQPQQAGWRLVAENCLILASDHNHGCLLPIDLTRPHTGRELAAELVALASVS